MTPDDLELRINRNAVAIDRLNERIEWIQRKIEWRRRRIRELGKERTEKLNFTLNLK